jgi:cell cycle checkpoint control protein RAD9A
MKQLTLKAMNSARSAFCSVVFKASSFDIFRVADGTLQTAVLAKHLMAALRTQRLERIVLSQAPGDRSKIAVELECGRNGITKTYGVHCVADAEHLKATLDAAAMPVKLVMRPKELGRLLSHFQSGQNDITISCLPEDEAGGRVGHFSHRYYCASKHGSVDDSQYEYWSM